MVASWFQEGSLPPTVCTLPHPPAGTAGPASVQRPIRFHLSSFSSSLYSNRCPFKSFFGVQWGQAKLKPCSVFAWEIWLYTLPSHVWLIHDTGLKWPSLIHAPNFFSSNWLKAHSDAVYLTMIFFDARVSWPLLEQVFRAVALFSASKCLCEPRMSSILSSQDKQMHMFAWSGRGRAVKASD